MTIAEKITRVKELIQRREEIDAELVDMLGLVVRGKKSLRCSKCGAKLKYVAGGHGSSDAPGYYFWPGLIALIVAVAGFCLGYNWTSIFGMLFSVPLIGWSFMARGEGYGNRCTACNNLERSFPWSM